MLLLDDIARFNSRIVAMEKCPRTNYERTTNDEKKNAIVSSDWSDCNNVTA